jgi:hypothetical protein
MTNSNVYVLFATHDEHAVYTRKVDDVASSVARLRTVTCRTSSSVTHRRREAQTGLGTVLTERYPGVWVADAADELLPDAEQRIAFAPSSFPRRSHSTSRLGETIPAFLSQ